MNKTINQLLALLSGLCVMLNAAAHTKDPNAYALMTVHDLQANATSNISLINRTTQPLTVNGLFVASVDATTSDDCSVCVGSVIGGDNLGGVMVSAVNFAVNQAVPIGQNYLYNMIYNGIYYMRFNVGSPCALPGCSWPGDIPLKWCLGINAASLTANYTYSHYTNGSSPAAAVPPYAAAGSSAPVQYDYNYDLIDPATFGAGNACLGPITCDDTTMTCQVSTPQSEAFQAY